MPTLRVNDILKDRILVSRESARLLEDAACTMLAASDATGRSGHADGITIDFHGVEGIAPSFLDELLSVFDSILKDSPHIRRTLTILHPPTRLSLKFAAVARGHDMSIQAQEDGSWTIAGATSSP